MCHGPVRGGECVILCVRWVKAGKLRVKRVKRVKLGGKSGKLLVKTGKPAKLARLARLGRRGEWEKGGKGRERAGDIHAMQALRASRLAFTEPIVRLLVRGFGLGALRT